MAALSDQVSTLQDVSATLTRYLEEVVTKVSPDASAELIRAEQARLESSRQLKELRENNWVDFVIRRSDLDVPAIRSVLEECRSFREFCEMIATQKQDASLADRLYKPLDEHRAARHDFNAARAIIGKSGFRFKERSESDENDTAESMDPVE